MKPHLPLPLLLLLTTAALGLTTTVVDEDFWEKAAQTISEVLILNLGSDVSAGGANDLMINSDLTVTAPSGTTASLHADTSSGGIVVSSGKSATVTGLRDVSIGGATTGSRKAAPTAGYAVTSWPVTGGVFIGEKGRMSISGNSGSVSNSGNSFSSSEKSSTVGSGGAAYFVAEGGTLDLNDNAGGVAVNNNNVTLSAASTDAYGAGIFAYTNATVNICGNNGVTLNNNGISSSARSAAGAAIHAHQSAVVNILNNSGTVDISHNSATTTYSNQTTYAGALSMAGATTLTISGNEAVSFTDNRSVASGSGANAYAGAIRADNILRIIGNRSVLFADNRVQSANGQVQGGAIRNGGSGSITISGNDSVRFLGNAAVTADSAKTTTNRMGGAIYSGANLSLCDNGELLFSGNSVRTGVTTVNRWNALGGAIYAAKGLTISGNDSVVFEKNYEQRGSSIVLRGIYQRSASDVQLQLSAKEGGSIIFREALYSELTHTNARAVFNGSYDAASGTYTRTGSGDIIFSGATTAADLTTLRGERAPSDTDADDLKASLTSEITAEAAVLGGSLRVEDGAALKFSKGLTVGEGATLALSFGGELTATEISLASGTTLSLAGAGNCLTAETVRMGAGSLVSLSPHATQRDVAALTLPKADASNGLLSGITLELIGLQDAVSGSYRLFTFGGTEDLTGYDTSAFTLLGESVDANAFRWDAGERTLFYDYSAPTADIIVDNLTSDFVLDTPTTGNLIVRDNRTATLNSALEAGGAASGDLILEHGTAALGEGASLSGTIIFAEGTAASARTLELAIDTTLAGIELQAAAGNTICVEGGASVTAASLSGSGALDKTGSGTLVLRGSESRLAGELTVQSGRLQLQEGAAVSGESILLGSRSRSAVTAEIVTDTMHISPLNGLGSLRDHADLTAEGTALGGTAETPAQLENLLVQLSESLQYALEDAVLCGSRVELAVGGSLSARHLVMDGASSLCAAAGASITLSGDNTLIVCAEASGRETHQGLSFAAYRSEQLNGVTLAENA